MAVAAAKSIELGFEALACASTGNLAGATAAAGAALGLPTYIFVPDDLEREKIIAAAAYGATVFAVDGNYDDVNRLCSELAYDRPWAFVNMNMRPYYAEGSKTIALETGRAAGLARARPGGGADRLRARCTPRSCRDSARAARRGCSTTARRRPCTVRRARAARRSASRLCGRRDEVMPVRPTGDRQVACDRQPRRRRLRAGGGARHRRSDRRRQRRRDRRGDQAAGPHHRHLHRDGRRRHHRRAAAAGRARRRSPTPRRWSSTSPATA